MGLDMYLTKKIYIGAQYEHRNITGSIDIRKDGKLLPIDLSKVSEIKEQAIYWRKANQIHNWFIKNCANEDDNCREMDVSREQLEELRDLCQKIVDECKMVKGQVVNGQTGTKEGWVNNYEEGELIENPEVAEELLPTTSGFFFGSTSYDQYYMDDIKYTLENLNKLLEETVPDYMDVYYSYHASW